MCRHNTGVNGITFDEELGPLPRKPSIWLDDWSFWFPILKDACKKDKPSPELQIYVTTGWGGAVDYDCESKQLTIPLGVACSLYNQYVEQLGIEANAATASQFAIDDLFALCVLYDNWGIAKGPWLLNVLLQSAIDFKLDSLIRFVASDLDREAMLASDFLDDLLNYVTSNDSVSASTTSRIHSAIREGPASLSVPESGGSDVMTYDVALSFAGENRQQAEAIASSLAERGIHVFYDKYEESTLWGLDLYEFLADVYSNRARFCIILISHAYAQKRWTTHERRNAQARAFRENREYILPVKVDDTQIPGIPETVGYLDLQHSEVEDVVRAVTEKLDSLKGR